MTIGRGLLSIEPISSLSLSLEDEGIYVYIHEEKTRFQDRLLDRRWRSGLREIYKSRPGLSV